MARPTPWWETIRLRDEIASASGAIEDVQMSLFNAVYGAYTVSPAAQSPTRMGAALLK